MASGIFDHLDISRRLKAADEATFLGSGDVGVGFVVAVPVPKMKGCLEAVGNLISSFGGS